MTWTVPAAPTTRLMQRRGLVLSGANHTRVIAVASGKGGVGKTNITVNLGLALARSGLRVAILDADLGMANVDVVLGMQPRYHLQHVITGQRSLSEIIVEGPWGLQVIPGASGLPDLADLPDAQREALLRSLLVMDGNVDILLIDSSSGVDRAVLQFILAAGELLLVTNTEPTAITDAYALVKVLAAHQAPVTTRLVVNSVQRRGDGEIVGQNLSQIAQRFLGRGLELVGSIPYDKSVIDAVRAQTPLLQLRPCSPAAVAIEKVAETLWTGVHAPETSSGMGDFFRQLLSLRPVALTAG